MIPARLVPRAGLGRLVASVSLGLLAGAALLMLSRWSTSAPAPTATLRPEVPQGVFEERVRAFLLEHPEVVGEALQRLEKRQREAEMKTARVELRKRADEVFRDPETPGGGNPDGDVTLVEFFDYNCPYCRRAAPELAKAEAGDPSLRIVYKELPILGKGSEFAAKAALAAHRQGKYVALHKALMAADGRLSEETVLATAGGLGLDMERLRKDMSDPAIQAHIERNKALAQALKIAGTPGFLIGEEIVPGAVDLDNLKRLISEARKVSDAPRPTP